MLGGQIANFVRRIQNWTTIESNQILAKRQFREASREGGKALGHTSAMHKGGLSVLYVTFATTECR